MGKLPPRLAIKKELIFQKFRNILDSTYKLLGKKVFFRTKSEKNNTQFRRSIFAVKDIKKGEKFTKNNIRRIRPGFGLTPVYYEKLLNKKSLVKVFKGEPIKGSHFKTKQ